MSKRKTSIIAVLVVLILIAGALVAALLRGLGLNPADSAASPVAATTTGEVTSTAEEVPGDPAEVLAGAEVNSIHPAPAPEAPEQWGEYQLQASWEGRLRVFESSDPQEIRNWDDDRFPATMNNCGFAMFFVTFRSTNPNVDLGVHLINAIGEAAVSEQVNEGWLKSTNCETPAMEFLSSADESNLGDVVYSVHEYWQASVLPPQPAATETPVSTAVVEPAPVSTILAEPTLVQCLGYLSPTGLYSDGSERSTPSCADSPEYQRSVRAEGVCGGLYGWMEVTEAEYLELCGIAPPTHLVPPTEPTPEPVPVEPEGYRY